MRAWAAVVTLEAAWAWCGLLAQQPDPISGGAGWFGAGLLGVVIAWLCLKHIPDREKQHDKDMDRAWAAINQQSADHKATITKLASDYKQDLDRIAGHCEKETTQVAEISERRLTHITDTFHREVGFLTAAIEKTYEQRVLDDEDARGRRPGESA